MLALFGRIDAELAPLGALVNNAGVVDARPLDAMSDGAAAAHVRDQRDRQLPLRA